MPPCTNSQNCTFFGLVCRGHSWDYTAKNKRFPARKMQCPTEKCRCVIGNINFSDHKNACSCRSMWFSGPHSSAWKFALSIVNIFLQGDRFGSSSIDLQSSQLGQEMSLLVSLEVHKFQRPSFPWRAWICLCFFPLRCPLHAWSQLSSGLDSLLAKPGLGPARHLRCPEKKYLLPTPPNSPQIFYPPRRNSAPPPPFLPGTPPPDTDTGIFH